MNAAFRLRIEKPTPMKLALQDSRDRRIYILPTPCIGSCSDMVRLAHNGRTAVFNLWFCIIVPVKVVQEERVITIPR